VAPLDRVHLRRPCRLLRRDSDPWSNAPNGWTGSISCCARVCPPRLPGIAAWRTWIKTSSCFWSTPRSGRTSCGWVQTPCWTLLPRLAYRPARWSLKWSRWRRASPNHLLANLFPRLCVNLYAQRPSQW